MTKKQFCVSLVILAIFGYLGGLSGFYLLPSPARADNNRVITCSQLEIKRDNIDASMSFYITDSGSPAIVIKNDMGHMTALSGSGLNMHSPKGDVESRYSAYGATIRYNSKPVIEYGVGNKAFIHINNNSGKLIWAAPNRHFRF